MSCGHAVTPSSLTNWCLRSLNEVGLVNPYFFYFFVPKDIWIRHIVVQFRERSCVRGKKGVFFLKCPHYMSPILKHRH